MRWLSLLLGLGGALLLFVLVRAQLDGGGPDGGPSGGEGGAAARSASGMAMLADYRCRRGETRRVVVRGVEDGYSVAGVEPAGLHPRLRGVDLETYPRQVGYDDPDVDGEVSDHFELPARVGSARLAIRFRPNGDNANDHIRIGDLATTRRGAPPAAHAIYAAPVGLLSRGRGWSQRGDLYWAELADLKMASGRTLLDLVRSGDGTRTIDVTLGDDTAVDFMAMAYCEQPAGGHGLTLAHQSRLDGMSPGVVAFDCRDDRPGGTACDPITGDQACEAALPLLCYRDRDLPAPKGVPKMQAELMTRSWSGGEVAATAPVAGTRFATIAEADRHCAHSFGKDWRVAEWHLGGRGWGFSARDGGRRFAGRYWVDIRGASYGTCWRRSHDD